MVVKVSKPEVNLREKISELDKPSGIAGEAMLRAETPQEQQAIIGMSGRKNLIINGDFKVNQRGGTHTTTSNYTLDRWKFQTDLLDQYTHNVTQSSDAPQGFFNSLAIAVTASETSIASTEDLALSQFIEAQECQVAELGMTLSFWVKSNVTGTFAVHLSALDPAKIYPSTYNIDHPNVWEKKTIVIPPLEHTINNDNGQGIRLSFITISGSAYASGGDINRWSTYTSSLFAAKHQAQVSNNADTWKLTGVQLEAGSVATPFEHRSYGEELDLCQRYFNRVKTGRIGGVINGNGAGIVSHPVVSNMRDTPTRSLSGTIPIYYMDGTLQLSSTLTNLAAGGGYNLNLNKANGSTGDGLSFWVDFTSSNYIDFDSEL